MTTVGVVIGTFGSEEWRVQGEELAEFTRLNVDADQVIHVHGDNLAEARNAGAKQIRTDYIVFLDADDRLCYNYCSVLKDNIVPGNVLYQPETQGWYGDDRYDETSNFIPDRDMNMSNNLVIGTAVTTIYGIEFDPILPALEDWDFFLRMISLGAKVKQCPGMIYYVGVRENSRNSPNGPHDQAYQIIRRKGIRVGNYLLENE